MEVIITELSRTAVLPWNHGDIIEYAKIVQDLV